MSSIRAFVVGGTTLLMSCAVDPYLDCGEKCVDGGGANPMDAMGQTDAHLGDAGGQNDGGQNDSGMQSDGAMQTDSGVQDTGVKDTGVADTGVDSGVCKQVGATCTMNSECCGNDCAQFDGGKKCD